MIVLKFVINREGPKVLFPWNYIGKGGEAKVYRKGDLAYKYYHLFKLNERLSLDEVQKLEKIMTKRILLPQDTLYTILGKFKGYTTQYVKDLGLLHFMMLPTDLVIDEFNLLKEDNYILSQEQIVISDLMPRSYQICNHSFNYGLYFIDPGKFYRDTQLSSDEVFLMNQSKIDDFLYFRVLSSYANQEIGRYYYDYAKLYQIKQEVCYKGDSLMDFIASDIKEDNLSEYVKRKIL